MKKFVIALLVSVAPVLFVQPCFARHQENSMKDLSIEAISQYAQMLLDRGDYGEAVNAYVHILMLDGDNLLALDKLKEIKAKGYPVSLAALAQLMAARQKAASLKKPEPALEAVKKSQEPVAQAVVIKPVVIRPVVPTSLEQDLVDLQQGLRELRVTMQSRNEQIKTLDNPIPFK